jgi:hypothetical protein
MTPEEFAQYQAKGVAQRATVNHVEVPITAVTTDDELAKQASRLSHRWAAPAHFVLALLMLERRVAQLETSKNPPGYLGLERR